MSVEKGHYESLYIWLKRSKNSCTDFPADFIRSDVCACSYYWLWWCPCFLWRADGWRYGGIYFIFNPNHYANDAINDVLYPAPKAMGATERISALLEYEEEHIEEGLTVEKVDQPIYLKNVDFSYGEEPILSDINFTIERAK